MKMMDGGWRRAALAAAVLLGLSAPAAAAAQGLTFAGGMRLYGEDEESALVASVRSEFPVGNTLLIELASSLADIPDGVSRATGGVRAHCSSRFRWRGLRLLVGGPRGVHARNGSSDGLDGVLPLASAGDDVQPASGPVARARLRVIGIGSEGEPRRDAWPALRAGTRRPLTRARYPPARRIIRSVKPRCLLRRRRGTGGSCLAAGHPGARAIPARAVEAHAVWGFPRFLRLLHRAAAGDPPNPRPPRHPGGPERLLPHAAKLARLRTRSAGPLLDRQRVSAAVSASANRSPGLTRGC